jgi:putative flippase GtrA
VTGTEPAPARSARSQVLRFLVVGGLNTAITYAIFVGLGLVIAPWLAYSIAFAIGLAWTGIGSSRFVFGVAFSIRRVALFIGCYLVVWGVGQLVILLIAPKGVVELLLTSLAVLVVTTPLIFLIGRFVFTRRPSQPSTEKVTP